MLCRSTLRETVRRLGPDEANDFKTFLSEQGLNFDDTLANYIRSDVRLDQVLTCVLRSEGAPEPGRLIATDDPTLGLIRGAWRDAESYALVVMAKRLISAGKAEYVLTGHTHSPQTSLDGRFINGGCWIPNHTVTDADSARDVIFEHGQIPFQLTYMCIPSHGGAPTLETHERGQISV